MNFLARRRVRVQVLVIASLGLGACPTSNGLTDASTDSTSTAGGTDDLGTDDPPCGPTTGDGAVGEPCAIDRHCASGFCFAHQQSPIDDTAACAAPPTAGVRVVGRVLDVVTGEPRPGADMYLGGATEFLIPDHYFDAQAEADGSAHFDIASAEIADPLGLVVEAAEAASERGGTLVSTANDVAAGIGGRDVWVLSKSSSAAWGEALKTSGMLGGSQTLADASVVVGIVRHAETGERLAGQRIVSVNDSSDSRLAYVLPGDAFADTETSSLGLVLILDAEPGELFKLDGQADDASCALQIALPAKGAVSSLNFLVR